MIIGCRLAPYAPPFTLLKSFLLKIAMKLAYQRCNHRDILTLFRRHANQAVVVRYRIQPDAPLRRMACVYYPECIDVVTYRSRVIDCCLVPVWDYENRKLRLIPLDGIVSITVSGQTYEIRFLEYKARDITH